MSATSGFKREQLPGWTEYAEREGLILCGKGRWRNLLCVFHADTKPSMRVNTDSGGWCCMACGVSGGDTLAYHMQAHQLDFVMAAKAMGAWHGTDEPTPARRHRLLSARDGLELLYRDAMLLFVIAADIGRGKTPDEVDRTAVAAAARRVLVVFEGTRT